MRGVFFADFAYSQTHVFPILFATMFGIPSSDDVASLISGGASSCKPAAVKPRRAVTDTITVKVPGASGDVGPLLSKTKRWHKLF